MNRYAFSLAASGLLAATAPITVPAVAQNLALEEVVVTARKREESLQDVPVAVSAFGAEAMQALGLKDMSDLEGLVPGLHLGGGGNGVKRDGNAFIRGVGQRETRVTIDSGVGIYLDDVYIARGSGALLDSVDVAQVQVLRGPQGTLFGKNTTGGAIIYRTNKPEPGLSGDALLSLGNYDRREMSATLNLPLVDNTLLSRWSLASIEQDGYIDNEIDGTDWRDDKRWTAVGKLRWLPSDNTSVDLNFNFTRIDEKPQGAKCNSLGDALAAAGRPGPALAESLFNAQSSVSVEEYCNRSGADLPVDKFQSIQNNRDEVFYQGRYQVDTATASATANWDINDALQLKSISAYRNTEQIADEDITAMNAALVLRFTPQNNDTDQYSQEFQLTGVAFDERLDYTLGAYAFHEETNDDWIQDFASYVSDTTTSRPADGVYNTLLARSNLTERETENTSYAAFSQFDLDLTEQLILTLGLRYTWEERTTRYQEGRVYLPSIGNGDYLGNAATIYGFGVLHSFSEPGGVPISDWQYGFDPDGAGGAPFEVGAFGKLEDSRKDSDWSPMASIKYLFGDQMLDTLGMDQAMTYLTYSSGFRSGGITVGNGDFDGDEIIDLENFKPEYVDMYEFGLKFEALDSKLRGNIAVFYQEYDDMQLTTTRPDPNLGIPLPAIENAGESEISGVETEFTFLPTQNLRFTGSVAYMDAEFKEWLSDVPDPDNPGQQKTIDRSDEPMPRAPEWIAFLSTDYFIHTDNWGTFIPNFVVRYTDEVYNGFDRSSFLVRDEIDSPAETFYDARLTWQSPGERFNVVAWVKNLTDIDDHMLGGIPTVDVARTSSQIFAPPRTYGLDIRYRFGD